VEDFEEVVYAGEDEGRAFDTRRFAVAAGSLCSVGGGDAVRLRVAGTDTCW
jgi:hypothetical protein